jgi:Na+-driven multidrug efflux pump
MDARTRLLLEAPIGSTLLRLAAPNVLVMTVQALIGVLETYFVAGLGTDALAGMALVFPVLMLVQMISAGAMGGGILSAVARALGANRREDADILAWHAVAIAVGLGVFTTVAAFAWTARSRPRSLIRMSCLPARCRSGCSTRWRPSSAAPATCCCRRR